MFKNIQDKLLISNPLLWNLKIVPFAFIALCFHIIFFTIGYISGTVDFTDKNYQNYDSGIDTAIVVFFSVIVSILTTIVWLVLYSRNNAFKSFYPKTNFSLFKEFLYIGLLCTLNCTFTLSYFYSKDLRTSNYYSQKEITKKLEILSLSSVFVQGSFDESNFVDVQVNGQMTTQQRDNFKFKDRTYSLNSLMNKKMESGSYFMEHKDSILSARVKNWLYENRKDSVKWVFDEFMKMSKEHHLQTNITSEKWLELVYNYPDFTKYAIIQKSKHQDTYDYSIAPVLTDSLYATASDTIQAENTIQDYSKYYVPYSPLQDAYREIAKAHENPTIDSDSIYIYLYYSIGLTLAIFSFKVTSGRNWLIAMVSLGVVSLIIGIFSAMSGGITFFIFYLILFFGLLAHFFIKVSDRKGKGISGITLNQILWMFPAVVPIIYYFTLEISKSASNYYESSSYNYESRNDGIVTESFPKIEWLENHFPEMIIFNIVAIILFIFFFSVQIKKWKGIAED